MITPWDMVSALRFIDRGEDGLPDPEQEPEAAITQTPLDELPSSPDDFLTNEDRRALRTRLDSISRKRRDAEAESQNLRIG